MNKYTEKVLFWILKHDYSKQHWHTVAAEMLVEDQGDHELSTPRLAQAIREFHIKFQDAVVKPGNVLYDFIDIAYFDVDWQFVAKQVIETYLETQAESEGDDPS